MTMSAFSSKCTHERDFPETITQFLCADVSIKNCCQSLPDFLPVQVLQRWLSHFFSSRQFNIAL